MKCSLTEMVDSWKNCSECSQEILHQRRHHLCLNPEFLSTDTYKNHYCIIHKLDFLFLRAVQYSHDSIFISINYQFHKTSFFKCLPIFSLLLFFPVKDWCMFIKSPHQRPVCWRSIASLKCLLHICWLHSANPAHVQMTPSKSYHKQQWSRQRLGNTPKLSSGNAPVPLCLRSKVWLFFCRSEGSGSGSRLRWWRCRILWRCRLRSVTKDMISRHLSRRLAPIWTGNRSPDVELPF